MEKIKQMSAGALCREDWITECVWDPTADEAWPGKRFPPGLNIDRELASSHVGEHSP